MGDVSVTAVPLPGVVDVPLPGIVLVPLPGLVVVDGKTPASKMLLLYADVPVVAEVEVPTGSSVMAVAVIPE
ncbi:hypothetical protein [Spirosoma sp.]|uniref:hypothetical protein n=1 Tax=Spirosoma sp. TaxID=1899569 RepID=UPI0026237575|nr:hypothetical protein [Spirosoma sp.]